ncbi:MAG: hypothetical protein CMB41_05035 [Euryarchaeota archaeon]|nr:hypothetical protein [Euryarchaeota archaeon]
MTAKTGNNAGTNSDECEDCGGPMCLHEHRGELECMHCGLTAPAPSQPMSYVPEGHGTTRTGNPYHKEATGSTIGTGQVDLRDVPAKHRAMYRRLDKHNTYAKPSQPQHQAAKVWDVIADENGVALANAMYDVNLLDDLIRPIRPDSKGSTLTPRAKAILAAAEAVEGIEFVQPSGRWCRSTSTGRTQAEREASKLTSEQKVALIAAAAVALYAECYPQAPSNMAATQTRLLERSGLDMKVAQRHMRKAKTAMKKHLGVLFRLGFFVPRARNAASHAQWVDDQVGLHLENVARVLSQDRSLTRHLDSVMRDAAKRLDAMKAVDETLGSDSPYLHLPPAKRAGLAVYCALHAKGLERGRRALLAKALILCDDTLPLLRERLLTTYEHGLEPLS